MLLNFYFILNYLNIPLLALQCSLYLLYVFLCFCGVCFWGGILINMGSFVIFNVCIPIVLGLEQYQSEYILGLKLYAKSSSLCLLSLTAISVCVVSYLKIQFAVNMCSIWCYISIYIFCSYDWYIHVPDVWIDISISIVDGVEYYPHICEVWCVFSLTVVCGSLVAGLEPYLHWRQRYPSIGPTLLSQYRKNSAVQ